MKTKRFNKTKIMHILKQGENIAPLHDPAQQQVDTSSPPPSHYAQRPDYCRTSTQDYFVHLHNLVQQRACTILPLNAH